MPSLRLGISMMMVPMPKPQLSIITSHPTGTANANGMVLRIPSLVAIAVVSMVLGPGEKDIATVKITSEMNSGKLKTDNI
jgi:hypothetical protein